MRVCFAGKFIGYTVRSIMIREVLMSNPIDYRSIEPCLIQEHKAPKKIIKKAKVTRRNQINSPIQGRNY